MPPTRNLSHAASRPVRHAAGAWRVPTLRMMAMCAGACIGAGRVALAQCPDGTPPPCGRPTRIAAAPAAARNSIAVLYFDNLSRDTSDAYLADGLTEEVITRLGQIERLAVKPRSAVRRFKGTTDDPATVGRALGVANLVTGSVRRAGNRLRVTVELVRAAGTVRLWGDAYDRTDGDVFAIQEDIARQVATAVAGQLAPAERASLASRPTRDPVAYDHLLRGNFYLAQRTPNAVRRAIAEYQAATQADPRFTAATARAAIAMGIYLSWGWPYPGLTADSLLALGMGAANRALRQDSSSTDAWEGLAALMIRARPLEVTAALGPARRATTLDPRNAEAWHLLGWMLGQVDDDAGAVAAFRRAVALEPGRAATFEQLARISYRGRRYAETQALLDSAIVLDQAFVFGYVQRALLRVRLGDVAGAQRDAEAVAGMPAGMTWAEPVLARVELAAGDSAGARARLARFIRADSGAAAIAAWLITAPALVAAGDTAAAFSVIERTAVGAEIRVWLKRPDYDAIRASPHFQQIVAARQPR